MADSYGNKALNLNLRKIYGHQFADKEMMDNYRKGWERIFGKKKDKKS